MQRGYTTRVSRIKEIWKAYVIETVSREEATHSLQ
jgi:hypothetical protein